MYEKKPLYRKDNTTPIGYHHNNPARHFRHERHTKTMKNFEGSFLSMHGKQERGYDYTPLFKFLLSKVGRKWDDVYSEAVTRLNKKEPIFWMVRLHPDADETPTVRLGDNSYYSRLTVDDNGILVKVDPDFDVSSMPVFCSCCTHTFNGVVYTKEYNP